MREIIDYDIKAFRRIENKNSIAELIKDGWQPFGEPFISGIDTYQAMVKYKDAPVTRVNWDMMSED